MGVFLPLQQKVGQLQIRPAQQGEQGAGMAPAQAQLLPAAVGLRGFTPLGPV